MKRHTFAVLAYKESEHLEECLGSLKSQTHQSEIIICTSTPSPFLEKIAARFGVQLLVNHNRSQIAGDWNFALSRSEGQYVTLAHQDDVYHSRYTQKVLAAAEKNQDALIVYTGYDELLHKGGSVFIRKKSLNFLIKKILGELSFRGRQCLTNDKRFLLALGNPIGCPTVTFHKKILGDFSFDPDFKINLDWKAWYDLAGKKGDFLWIRETLVSHRIHAKSETSQGIRENKRQEEDLAMFHLMWPRPLAKFLALLYSLSYKNNS